MARPGHDLPVHGQRRPPHTTFFLPEQRNQTRQWNTKLQTMSNNAQSACAKGFLSHVPPSTSACISTAYITSVISPNHAPQFMHAPLHQLSGSQIHARQRKASCGATVNCRMSIVYSNRSTGDWPRFTFSSKGVLSQPCIDCS